MSAGPNANGASDRKKLLTILVPAIGVAVLVLIVVLFSSMTGSGRSMSDGSDGSADDPGLKDLSAGVKYRDLKEGEGHPCPPGAKVRMLYTGWLTSGTVFDSTKDRRESIEFDLKQLIKGWQEGIPGMKPGGIRKLVISPEKGYGVAGSGQIPPNSTLIFEVELVSYTLPRRSPIPDLSRLSDGTDPHAADPGLKPIGSSGLMYRDLKVGDGAEVLPAAKVVVDYIGWRHSDGGIFDSSFRRAETFPADLGSGVIDGWKQGIPGMKVGGIRKLVIPPGLAYGNQSKSPEIPASSTLVFEVEVLGIEP